MKFDYGDEVVLATKDDSGNPVEKVCYVVAITPIENEEQAKVFKYPLGVVLYTVEFRNGTDALVPECDLRHRPELLSNQSF
jgi:hypothetical protein